jgi:polyisoprenyl-phosphate glycosyltransferase
MENLVSRDQIRTSDGLSSERFRLSIIVPMYNEEAVVEHLIIGLDAVLREIDADCEIVCVNDGSTDGTLEKLLLLKKQFPAICVVDLSRNFGKENALTAGLEIAGGDAVIPIDADLQDPPELIPKMIEKWRVGYDVVYGVRVDRRADGAVKRWTAKLFYRFYNRISNVPIPRDTGDFRLIDRKVVEALRKLPEHNRFMKGLFAWVGFKQIGIEYSRPSRAAGETKWNYWRLWNFALDGLTAFSTLPLRVWSYIGAFVSLLSFVYLIFLVFKTLIMGVAVPGYASLMVVVLFLGGIQLITLGVIGEYLGRLYSESKGRPNYLVNRIYGADTDTGETALDMKRDRSEKSS